MTFLELQKYLSDNHFHVNKTEDLEKGEIINLWVDGYGVAARDREARLKELLADKPFQVNFIPNLEQIHITQKP